MVSSAQNESETRKASTQNDSVRSKEASRGLVRSSMVRWCLHCDITAASALILVVFLATFNAQDARPVARILPITEWMSQ